MHPSIILLALSSSISFVMANPSPLLAKGAHQVNGVATFNDYSKQSSTVCRKFKAGTFLESSSCHFTTNHFFQINRDTSVPPLATLVRISGAANVMEPV